MNEEEIIKNLEEFLKGPCEICKYCDGAIRNHRKAIQGLLDLYQKEKEKNNELEYKLREHICIEAIGKVDRVVFMKGWERARGCVIEHLVAVKYNKEIIYCN